MDTTDRSLVFLCYSLDLDEREEKGSEGLLLRRDQASDREEVVTALVS